MIKHIVSAVTIVLMLCVGLKGWSKELPGLEAKNPIVLSLSSASKSSTLTSPITVQIQLKNTGNKYVHRTLLQVPYSEYYGFAFTLTLDGREIPRSKFYKALRREPGASHSEVPHDFNIETKTIAPGQSEQVMIDLKRLFEITEPGLYVFSVTMRPDRDVNTAIQAPPLDVLVTQ